MTQKRREKKSLSVYCSSVVITLFEKMLKTRMKMALFSFPGPKELLCAHRLLHGCCVLLCEGSVMGVTQSVWILLHSFLPFFIPGIKL